jgi:hypothetical protein
MRLRPQSPVEGDLGPSSGCSVKSSRHTALNTASSVSVALDVDAGDILDGAVSGDRSGDALGLGVHVRVGVGVVELVFLSADDGALNVAVSGGDGRGGEDGGDVTHVVG